MTRPKFSDSVLSNLYFGDTEQKYFVKEASEAIEKLIKLGLIERVEILRITKNGKQYVEKRKPRATSSG